MINDITAEAFHELWAINYPKAPPLSYLMRQLYPERWLRVHSLPEARRYPETEADWRLLLERHFTVLREVFGDLADAVLVSSYYTVATEPEHEQFLRENTVLNQLDFKFLSALKLGKTIQEPDDNLTYWPVITNSKLTIFFIEQLFRAIAMDECRAFIIHKENGIVVAPYDGGIDIFLPDSPTRDFYRQRYQDWLSPYPSGL